MVPSARGLIGAVVVSDAGPLLSFARAGEIELLRTLLVEIAIPPAVYDEILTRGAGRAGAVEVAAGDWVRVHPVTLPFADISTDLGEGERQAMALARELGLQLVIDEGFGRQEAQRLGLVTMSTLSLLEQAKLSGMIPAAKPVLGRLLAEGYRLSQRLYRGFFDCLGEYALPSGMVLLGHPPLPPEGPETRVRVSGTSGIRDGYAERIRVTRRGNMTSKQGH